MKRFLGVAAVCVLTAALLTISTPASSHADVCVGNGTATTLADVYYPVTVDGTTVHTPPSRAVLPGVGFGVSFVGVCASDPLATPTFDGGQFTAGSLVGNYCGQSTGTATLNGHRGDWVSAASMLVFTGAMTGVVNAVPDALNGESCASGANNFVVTGALAGTDVP